MNEPKVSGRLATGVRSLRQRWLIGGALLVVFAGQVAAFHGMRFDDAFITYRYGENLANGQGLTFNPGERFLGSTSPGHMLLTAGVYRLVGHAATPSVMSALGCLGWSAQVLAVYLLLQPALGLCGATLVAGMVALGAARSYLWVPLETQLVAALSLFALLAAREKRWNLTAALAALACLMRPDAALLATLLAGLCLWDRRGRVLLPALVFAAIALPWVVFATRYYGSALPHSALEKFQRSPLPKYFWHMLRLFAESVFPLAKPPAYYLHAVAWLLIAGGAFVLARRDAFFRVILVFALLFFGAYLLLRPIAGHDWHLYPLSVLAVVFAYAGLYALASAGTRRGPRIAGAALLVALSGLAVQRSVKAVGEQRAGFWTGARDETYRRIAGYLAEHGQPGDRFASIEVGTLAYYSGLAAYDLGGLVTDLRRDAMVDRNVRFLVLDKRYLAHAPPVEPVFSAMKGEFEAYVYYLSTARERRVRAVMPMPNAKLLILGALCLLAAGFGLFWLRRLRGPAPGMTARRPGVRETLIGAVTDFLDTLGIGSFATTTSLYRQFALVPDRLIPGTLNVGHALPTVAQALIYIALIDVELTTLGLMLAAAVLGASIGAGMVAGWPERTVRLVMGCALLAAALLMLARLLALLPAGGDASGLSGGLLALGVAGNFVLGALMTMGIGLYAPCMILVALLGMSPKVAFPIMMGSCAFLMPVAGMRFIKREAYAPRAALGLTLGGLPAVLVAAYVVKELPLDAVRVLVLIAVSITAVGLLRAGLRQR